MGEAPILMTGGSGFLGRACLRAFGELPDPPALELLLRREARVRLSQEGLLRPQWGCLEGDLAQEKLALPSDVYERIAGRLGGILHCAGNVRFDLNLEEARRVNVTGTRRLLELAEAAAAGGRRIRFDHVSTAYVIGRRSGSFTEGEAPRDGQFCNTYEQSKWEAEQAVCAAAEKLAVTIYRPSILLPGSVEQSQPGALAPVWCARILGSLLFLPGRPSARLDLIAVDQAARVLVRYLSREAPGGVIHLSAGSAHALSLGELVELAAARLGVRQPPWVAPEHFRRWVRPLLWVALYGRARAIWRSGENLLPYLEQSRCFEPLRASSDFPWWSEQAAQIRERLNQLLGELEPSGRA